MKHFLAFASLALLLAAQLTACAPATESVETPPEAQETALAPLSGDAEALWTRAYVTDEYRFGESETFWADWVHWSPPEGGEAWESEFSLNYKALGCEDTFPGFQYRIVNGDDPEWTDVLGESATLARGKMDEGDTVEVRFTYEGQAKTESFVLGEPEPFFLEGKIALERILQEAGAQLNGREIDGMTVTLRYARLDAFMARWQFRAAEEGQPVIAYFLTDVNGQEVIEPDVPMVSDGEGGYCPAEY